MPLQIQRYKKHIVRFPVKGMNVDIAPEYLKPEYAVDVTNFLPSATGTGQLREGTSVFYDIDQTLGLHDKVIHVVPYKDKGALIFVKKLPANQIYGELKSGTTIEFKCADDFVELGIKKDQNDEPIVVKAKRSLSEDNIFILEAPINGLDGDVIVEKFFVRLYFYNKHTGETKEYDDISLSPFSRITDCFYQNRLFIMNGVDPVHVFDDSMEFKIFRDARTMYTHKNISVDGQTLVLHEDDRTVADDIRHSLGVLGEISIQVAKSASVDKVNSVKIENKTEGIGNQVLLVDFPLPPFSYMTVLNDRGVALGGLKDDPMTFYYQAASNSVKGWYGNQDSFNNDKRNSIPKIEMRNKQEVEDRFHSVFSFNGSTFIAGTKTMQVWEGDTLNALESKTNFAFKKTLDIGIYSNESFVKLSNSYLFFNKNGLWSLSASKFTNEPVIESVSGINSIIKEQDAIMVTAVNKDNFFLAYNRDICFAGSIKDGKFLGLFKFDGDFSNILYARTFGWDEDKTVISDGRKLLFYQNGIGFSSVTKKSDVNYGEIVGTISYGKQKNLAPWRNSKFLPKITTTQSWPTEKKNKLYLGIKYQDYGNAFDIDFNFSDVDAMILPNLSFSLLGADDGSSLFYLINNVKLRADRVKFISNDGFYPFISVSGDVGNFYLGDLVFYGR